MKIAVLGAGLAGVCAAWYLNQNGHQVTVVDRGERPGEETSFANGGQISVSHPEPWANPGAPAQILRWLGREDAPLKFRLRADPAQWVFALRFLAACLPSASARHTAAIAQLAVHSLDCLRSLRESEHLDYDARSQGILHLFFDQSAYRAATHKVQQLAPYGISLTPLSATECLDREPALAACQAPLAGGLYAPQDESGDAFKFVSQLAARARQHGVAFRLACQVDALTVQGRRVTEVRLTTPHGAECLEADAVVVALGSYGNALLRPLGLGTPVYPLKGYSVTLPLADDALAPSISITDESRRIVMSRLGNRLRVAGTAELAGHDLSINPSRCAAILRRALSLFPEARTEGEVSYWAGLRPATPTGLPLIGRYHLDNLYLNTGHGTLGWTLACGSAQALADILSDRPPQPDFPFLGR